MKLFEEMEGGSIKDAIQKMVNDMFREELDDDQIEEIVNDLSLSDLLALDKAYTDGDKETVSRILGPLPQLEYSMGVNRQPTSAASNRPAPGRAQQGQQQKKEPGTQNTVQTIRNYSSGAQNAVTTQNIDNEDDPDQVMQDPEPIEESDEQLYLDLANRADEWAYDNDLPFGSEHMGVNDMADEFAELGIDTFELAKEWVMDQIRDPNSMWNAEGNFGPDGDFDDFEESVTEGSGEQWNSQEVVRALEEVAMDAEPDDPEGAAGLQMLANRINQSFPDSVDMSDIHNMLREPQLRGINFEDVKYALQATGFLEFESVQEELDQASVEAALRDMAEKYQAAMAGMYDAEDPSDIAATMEELAAKYGLDIDDYLENPNESVNESNVVDMVKWLKRRAGIA